MPPDDEDQPSHEVRASLIAGIYDQFRLAGNPVEQLRTSPRYGNYINHEELFSGIHKGPAYSRPRIWRISPYIDGQSSPFSLSQEEGFKDYEEVGYCFPGIDPAAIDAALRAQKKIKERNEFIPFPEVNI